MNDGKLILQGEIELLSALHVGSGESDSTDLDIIKDNNDKPFITFTSFIGALKHHLTLNYSVDNREIDLIFGYPKDEDTWGSKITGSDLFLKYEPINLVSIRDGIKIDIYTGVVQEGAKYDFQIVERGTKFSFKLETAYSTDSLSKETLLRYYSTIIKMLKSNDLECQSTGLRIGAKTNNGLGKVQLINEKLYDYDFSHSKNVIAWLKRNDIAPTEIKGVSPFVRYEIDLIIDAYFDLKSSLIQRSYSDDASMPDSSHIQSGGKNILTGEGTKGAVATRVKEIVNTVWRKGETSKIKFIDQLLGYVHDPKDKKDARENKEPVKAKLQIEERELPGYVAELQARIKIDRFVNGTINGALFDSMPLFNTMEIRELPEIDLKKKYTRLTIIVNNCTEAETGLIFLVLKDIWTGDLAIGGEKGIGRGVFNGVSAFIKYKNEDVIELSKGLENLLKLQKYVSVFTETAGVNNGK
jgi:CRISPR/Cas system CSM-associated protein Csm3 (group 7 of RAMP superfamily)